jgi:hypothetical protein
MTARPAPEDQEIIEILKQLETLKAEYPPDLLAARRAAFIAQIDERKEAESEAKEELPSEAQVAAALGGLKNAVPEYPSELFSARRVAFLSQVKQQKEIQLKEASPSRTQVLEVLGRMKNAPAEYPADLLAARRAAFLAQIEQHNQVEVVEDLPVESARLVRLFDRLKSVETEYPLKLWAARRAAFLKQISRDRLSILEALRSSFRNILDQLKAPQAPRMRLMRSSLIMAGILLAAFIGTLLYGNQGTLLSPPLAQSEASQPVVAPSTTEAVEVICKPGYLPPLCLAQESTNKSEDLTYQGNGSARPAVAKDTIPGYSDVHQASYVNDGLYGAGASWISNSAYSWIKIDLGMPRTINTITFGRDRLGNYNDRDPGQFVIAVALHDDVYADGNSSNDFFEYTKVYDSKQAGFDGIVSGAETIQATFAPTEARYVKITFENAGTAIDEVEAFMIQPSSLAYIPTQKTRDNQPRPTWTPVPTDTLVPTSSPTPVPTDTPLLTDTPTPVPTDTPLPTSTPTDVPTNTPYPTNTPTNVPTNTPRPTHTSTPRPTSTPTDVPTNTPHPTNTPTNVPTNTPHPTNTPTQYPTNTPFPTDTPVPPTDTPVPVQPTDTTGPLFIPTNTPFPTSTPFPTDTPFVTIGP